jgi:hypothetical protein
VTGAAFGSVRDPVGWLLRGLVEAGMPELPAGGGEPGAWGGWEIDANGTVAIRIRALDWDDERSYVVHRMHGPQGPELLVFCRDAVFRQPFPEMPLETLGARVLAHVRHHDAAFAAWRAQGGQLGPAERASVGEVRGAMPPDAELVRFVAWLRAHGAGLAWGPHAGWWPVQAAPPIQVAPAVPAAGGGRMPVAGFGGITAGRGSDPTYRLRPVEADLPHNRAYADSVRRAGRWLLPIGIVVLLIGMASLGYLKQGKPMLALFQRVPVLAGLAAVGCVQGVLLGLVGHWMRTLTRLEATRWLAIAATFCVNAAFLLGCPAGAYAWWLLRDDRAAIVFERTP